MKRAWRPAAVGLVVLVATSALLLSGCGTVAEKVGPQSSVGGLSGTTPSNTEGGIPGDVEAAKQQAIEAARAANLAAINAAIQVYYASEEKWPTSVNQLVPQYLPKLPMDPGGGTYYIQTVAGQAQAAVR